MNSRLIALLLLVFLISCRREPGHANNLLNYIPVDAEVILKINDLARLKSELKNNGVLPSFGSSQPALAMKANTQFLKYLRGGREGILSILPGVHDSTGFVFATRFREGSWDWENEVVSTTLLPSADNSTLMKYVVDTCIFYSVVRENEMLIGSSPELLGRIMAKRASIQTDPAFLSLFHASNPSSPATIFFNIPQFRALQSRSTGTPAASAFSRFADWVSLDLDSGQDHLDLHGVAMARKSTTSFINLFKNSLPNISNTVQIAPAGADAVVSWNIGDYKNFESNREAYLGRVSNADTLPGTAGEIGCIYIKGKKVVMLHTPGTEQIFSYLGNKGIASSEYQGNEITELNESSFLNENFSPLINDFKARFYTVLENTFVFAPDMEILKAVIASYNRGDTFDKSAEYTTMSGSLANSATIWFVANAEGVSAVLKDVISDRLLKDFNMSHPTDYMYAGQIVAGDNFYLTNIAVKKRGEAAAANTTSPVFSVELDGELVMNPQFVTNHRTHTQEVVIQDKENNLYLISGNGKVLWKKKLRGRVQGPIAQVDLYRNGRLQLAFTTDDQFLILDRNGTEVEPFVKYYPGGNLNPLAVFDYEGDRNYRFLVTQAAKVDMFNNKGRKVAGFVYDKAESPVTAAPQHFRIGSKDYLLFKLDNGNLKILSRAGKPRVRVDEHFDFSDNRIMLYNDKFTFTDARGMLIAIDQKGKITRTALNLARDHGTDATSKSLVTMNDNELTIKGKKVTLDLGVYTRPRIFYIYDKIYVTVTDLQGQKAYLFDSNGIPLQGFPVFASSLIDLADMDNDKKLEVVAKDRDNSLTVYKIN